MTTCTWWNKVCKLYFGLTNTPSIMKPFNNVVKISQIVKLFILSQVKHTRRGHLVHNKTFSRDLLMIAE